MRTYQKPLSLLALFTFSFSVWSFSASRFENQTCPQTLADRGNGYYSVRAPLVYQGQDTTVLQKVNGPETPYYEVYNSQKTFRLEGNPSNIQDFIVYQEDLWILASGDLLQFSANGKLLNTFRYPHYERYEGPLGLELVDQTLYIAHGKLGLVKFDLRAQEFEFVHAVNTWQEDGLRSQAVSVTIKDGRAYVALSGLNQGAFNGIVLFDLKKGAIVNSARYRNGREGVIDPRAKIYAANGDIYLNNGGWIHRHEVKDIERRRNAKPFWMAIPHRNGDLNRFLMIRGDFVFTGSEILGCAINERKPVFARRVLN